MFHSYQLTEDNNIWCSQILIFAILIVVCTSIYYNLLSKSKRGATTISECHNSGKNKCKSRIKYKLYLANIAIALSPQFKD